MGDDRAEHGAVYRRTIQGEKSDQLHAALVALDPDLGRWADEFIFGDVWTDPALNSDQRIMVAIIALAATGRRGQLKNYLHSALQHGIESDRLRASLRMLVVYVGFPAAIDALVDLETALKSKGGTGHA